jgi:hypothetical protein
MKALDRLGDAFVSIAADATEGCALARLARRAAYVGLDVVIVPVALVTFATTLFIWHCASTRSSR